MAEKKQGRSGSTQIKLSGVGVTQPERHGPYQLTLKFDEDTFCKAVLRHEQKHSDVAARLRKLA
jgi:hypothetical protein